MESKSPIVKKIIHSGQKFIPILNGAKVHFHFQTWKLDPKKELLDDSKLIGKKEPMVLVIGHKFKLEVWEKMVKMMAVGEVASFKVNKELVTSYPFVSKTLRDLGKNHAPKHSCTMTLQSEGLGYNDLDQLMQVPADLEFIFELLKVETASEYEKDIWQLNQDEKLSLVPKLKEKGNKLYVEKRFQEAEEVYCKAIGICEQLMIRERKVDPEWQKLNSIKLPILLNYAQCRLNQEDYYTVIEHCNTVLEHDKDNIKALYRRGKAHIGAWNPIQAEEDFKRIKELDSTMAAAADKEINIIKRLLKEKSEKDKEAMQKLFTDKS